MEPELPLKHKILDWVSLDTKRVGCVIVADEFEKQPFPSVTTTL